jgi:hypothetical protein
VQPLKSILFFHNTSDKFGASNPEKAFRNNENREFFAMSADDIAGMEKIIFDYIDKRFK